MKQKNIVALGVIGVGIIAAAVTGYQARNLGTSSSVAKSQIPADAVTATGEAQGLGGPVKVEVIANAEKIFSINVLDASGETPNIGTLAVDQLPASIFEANSLSVDSVSGATITSTAIKNAAAQAIESAGFDPANFGFVKEEKKEVVVDTSDIPADAVTATGEAQGLGGPVKVEITATADKIYNLVATGDNETPGIGTKALEELPGAIISANSVDVDAISGATVTSDAIKEAARKALESAGFSGGSADAADTKETAAETEKATDEKKDIPADAVTVTGEAQGLGGPVKVEITATADKIYDIVATGDKETPGIGSKALEELPEAIISANSVDVDAISGATVTSDAIKEAAKKALESADFDKADSKESEAETKKASDDKSASDEVTAEGEAQGLGGPVKVEITATADKIIKLVATGDKETPGIGSKALEELPEAIISANSVDVDAISGATVTSDAIKEAAKKALESAGFDPASYK